MTHIHLSAVIVVALMIALPTGCIYNNADIFLSEDEARIAYKAMIEAQEQDQ